MESICIERICNFKKTDGKTFFYQLKIKLVFKIGKI